MCSWALITKMVARSFAKKFYSFDYFFKKGIKHDFFYSFKNCFLGVLFLYRHKRIFLRIRKINKIIKLMHHVLTLQWREMIRNKLTKLAKMQLIFVDIYFKCLETAKRDLNQLP